MKNNLSDNYRSTYYNSDVDRIHDRTGLPKDLIRKCLSVFRLAFKNYLKSPMDKPLRIPKVFTIYKKKHKRTPEQFKNWRKDDRNLPYKK